MINIGDIIGEYKILSKEIVNGKTRLSLQCSCGIIKDKDLSDFNKQKNKCCKTCLLKKYKRTSCKTFIDLTNYKFMNWTVIKIGNYKYGNKKWLCQCDCRYNMEISEFKLKKLLYNICPNCSSDHRIIYPRWKIIEKSAKSRNIDFDITLEEILQLYYSQNKLCAISGKPIDILGKQRKCTASLDRKNSKLGYTKENCQWVHKTINLAKNCLTNEQFITLCLDVTNYNKEFCKPEDWENRDKYRK